MLHIILTILKILGIVLLVLLALILLILLAVLLVPVRYRAAGEKSENGLRGEVIVSWLLHMLHIRIRYENEQTDQEIFLFGIPLSAVRKRIHNYRTKRRRKKRIKEKEKSKNKTNNNQGKAKPERKTDIPAKTESKPAAAIETEPKPAVPVETESKPAATIEFESKPAIPDESKSQSGPGPETQASRSSSKWIKRVGGILRLLFHPFIFLKRQMAKVLEKIRKIKFTIRGICGKMNYYYELLKAEATKTAMSAIWCRLKKVLKHTLPGKIRGTLHFGLDDPSWTGQILAIAAVFYPRYGRQISLVPYFDRQILEGKLEMRGRIRVGTLLWHGLQLYLNKEVKQLYKKIRHKEA